MSSSIGKCNCNTITPFDFPKQENFITFQDFVIAIKNFASAFVRQNQDPLHIVTQWPVNPTEISKIAHSHSQWKRHFWTVQSRWRRSKETFQLWQTVATLI